MAKTKAEESKRKVSNNSPKSGGNKKRKVKDEAVKTEEESTTTPSFAGEEVEEEELVPDQDTAVSVHAVVEKVTRNVAHREDLESKFIGDPVPLSDAKSRWPHRYPEKKQRGRNLRGSDDEDEIREARCHYLRAEIDGTIYELNDDAHVMSEEGKDPYICKIKEFFVDERDGSLWFRAQWYYRAKDTVIQDTFAMREPKRIFPSEVMDDNPLDCLLGKLKIIRVKPNLDVAAKLAAAPECDYYYDMHYKLSYNSFVLPPGEIVVAGADSESALSSDADDVKTESGVVNQVVEAHCSEMTLLDLYCGCGAMSTGLCLGANLCGINLVTKWAVDLNEYACESVKLNHPETQVRNETVENFLMLLKEWERLCATYKLIKSEDTHKVVDAMGMDDEEEEEDEDESGDQEEAMDSEVFEVEKMMEICYGDPNNDKKTGLYFKVRWKGYGASEDTWEPVDGLGNCRESIGVFVKEGFKNKVLPLPGDVDMVCGGPPCQGISGFNRFRNRENPLADEKNKQLLVFMNVVNYLKPKYVLMENVVDLVKFAKGFLGRYAVGSLVDMNYQARMGMMAAGAYGLPQFRMRVFVWGTQPTEKLVPYPLPTHDLVLRGVIPSEFETNVVAYNEGHNVNLQNKLFLGDAITDLPEVNNDEHRDVMPYDGPPQTEFQRFIRLTKDAMCGRGSELLTNLYDHRPLKLNNDDYQRVCRVPKRKGANFRDFPGVRVRHDNKVEWDPDVERVILPSGKPLVPEYAMTFVQGTSSKPFGRLWWDQTVPTVVTRAEPHNQTICHPLQDRVLTIRENARLQGFPDYYQLIGPIKQRYMQVGNAVAVPVARALGFGMAMANKGLIGDDPLFVLPEGFPAHPVPASPAPSIEVEDS